MSNDHLRVIVRTFKHGGRDFQETVFPSGYVEIEPADGTPVLLSREPHSRVWVIEDWVAYDSELAIRRAATHHMSKCLSLRAALRKAGIRCKRATNV